MPASAESLLVRIDATTELLRKELKRADDAVSRSSREMNRQLGRADAAFSKLNSTAATATAGIAKALGALSIAIGSAELVRGIGNTLDGLQEIQRAAAGIGITTDAVQELTYTFRQFAVPAGDVIEGLAQLSSQAQGAITGSSSLIQTWGQLGITVDQLRGKKPDELFRLLAQGIAQTEDPTVRLAAASTLLGEDLSGKLLPLLVQGAAGLDKFKDKAHELGAVLDEDMVKSGADAAQKINDLKAQFSAEFTQAVAANADEIAKLGDALLKVSQMAVSATSGMVDFFRQLTGTEDEIERLIRVRDKWLAHGRTADDPLIQQYNQHIARLVRERQQSMQQPTQLGTVTVTAPRAVGTPKDAHRFDPEAGFFDELEQARFEKFFDTAPLDKFREKLEGVNETTMMVRDTAAQVGRAFADNITDAIVSGRSFKHVLGDIIAETAKLIIKLGIELAIRTAIKIVSGGAPQPSGQFFAKGGAFNGGNVLPFANGGVVTSPTLFPFADGSQVRTGLMAERGPEAIMPLKRLSGGALGVSAAGMAPNITIIDQRRSDSPPVSINQRQASNGQQQIEVLIRDTTQRLFSQGDMDNTLQQNFGIRRQGRFGN